MRDARLTDAELEAMLPSRTAWVIEAAYQDGAARTVESRSVYVANLPGGCHACALGTLVMGLPGIWRRVRQNGYGLIGFHSTTQLILVAFPELRRMPRFDCPLGDGWRGTVLEVVDHLHSAHCWSRRGCITWLEEQVEAYERAQGITRAFCTGA